jgi:hypothetical protein
VRSSGVKASVLLACTDERTDGVGGEIDARLELDRNLHTGGNDQHRLDERTEREKQIRLVDHRWAARSGSYRSSTRSVP